MQKDIIKKENKTQCQLAIFKKTIYQKGKKMMDENMFLHPNLVPFFI